MMPEPPLASRSSLWAARTHLPQGPVSRFAPSPTGPLHLGHVAHALWVWGFTKALGGRVLLRMEDHDRTRCRVEYEADILEALDWLGFQTDPPADQSPPLHRQSDSSEAYREALARLEVGAGIYGCTCTRGSMLRESAEGMTEGEVRHPERCAAANRSLRNGLGVRARLPGDEVVFTDLRLGPIRQRPVDQCGDLLVRDPKGQWTYQFAVTVDDYRQGVSLVIRGEDLMPSTGRQILLGRLLGCPSPATYLHHPLVRHPDGTKLSKRAGAGSLLWYRERGVPPEEVIGLAAYLTGLQSEATPCHADQVVRLFEAGQDGSQGWSAGGLYSER